MTACEECWAEAQRQARLHGDCVGDRYRALLKAHDDLDALREVVTTAYEAEVEVEVAEKIIAEIEEMRAWLIARGLLNDGPRV